jgi:hypothetical protein
MIGRARCVTRTSRRTLTETLVVLALALGGPLIASHVTGGSWTGTTAQSRTFNLTVDSGGNNVTQISYSASTNCGTISSTISGTMAINASGTFSFDAGGICPRAQGGGTFSSATAAGTLTLTYTPIPFVCGCSGTFNTAWTAASPAPPAPAPAPAAPFGAVDTPAQGANNVTGSIAVTGWALDDAAVTRLRILRDPVGAEPAGTQVFIGNAVFVTGARPDIAAAYPSYPSNTRAGWGYLLLTNVLPNQGNGVYTLHMYADDANGNSTLLGSRTITCTNATATKPFGAIDTPSQGETVSGASYVNFGWALTPLPKVIPTDGSTIGVYVDGVLLGRPAYNQFRSDIATLFPGLNNSNGPVGALVIDTTKLSNGVHTISWSVADSSGASEGIGSRYFTVQNGSTLVADREPTSSLAADAWASWPVPDGVVTVKRGYREGMAGEIIPIDKTEGAVFTVRAGDRVEVTIDAGSSADAATLDGYAVETGRLSRLPIGSTFDGRRGVFVWTPGVGFLGRHDLVFFHRTPDRTPTRIPLSIILEP